MNLIYLGKFVNTHSLKGEIRIVSDFEYKYDVFKPGNKLYIDNKEFTIKSYRVHKNYDMVTFLEVNSIDQMEPYKGYSVYINKDDYNFKLIYDDLIGMKVYDNDLYKGKVKEILKSRLYPILKIKLNKEYMVPLIDEFVKSIDTKKREIKINYIKGLNNED